MPDILKRFEITFNAGLTDSLSNAMADEIKELRRMLVNAKDYMETPYYDLGLVELAAEKEIEKYLEALRD